MTATKDGSTNPRGTLSRSRSNFLTRTATDDGSRLNRRESVLFPPAKNQQLETPERHSGPSDSPYDPASDSSQPPPRQHSFTKKVLGIFDGGNDEGKRRPSLGDKRRSSSKRRRTGHGHGLLAETSLTAQMHGYSDKSQKASLPRVGSLPRPVGGDEKLGTFSGVFVPTSLNVLSILMFIRFGFILGQSGVIGMLGP